jgi:mannose-6-phosphate isomerase-like protein (cupin superfamily)
VLPHATPCSDTHGLALLPAVFCSCRNACERISRGALAHNVFRNPITLSGSPMPTELMPQAIAETEGPAFWFLNNLCIVKATTESTGGSFAMLYQISPPGSATPYHLHHDEDEAFYILAGEYTFICDGVKHVVGPGGYVFLPRGIPHGIRVTGSVPATMLVMAMPGRGFFGMMEEMAVPALERVLPEPSQPDIEKLTRLCTKYRIDILGPLPD